MILLKILTSTHIVHGGKVSYMLKQSAKLQRERKPIKKFDADYSLIKPRQTGASRRGEEGVSRRLGQYSTPTIEMEDEKEEIKESSTTQRSTHSRFDQI